MGTGTKDRINLAEIKELINAQANSQMALLLKFTQLPGDYGDFLEKPEDAERIYNPLFAVLNNRSIISPDPTNQRKDGKGRSVRIEVLDYSEYLLRYKAKSWRADENSAS